MVDLEGTPTTGLLQGVRYVKDNRVLPRGFDKLTASSDVAVHGAAVGDSDFQSGRDQVRYVIDVSNARGPITLDAELRFQTISFRWARNLATDAAAETKRFSSYYASMAPASSFAVAHARTTLD
jgi:hypothetical protein